jgi:hypothetical protein
MNSISRPVIIIHEPTRHSAKLPPKYRFEYNTAVDGEKVTLTVSVMKIRNSFLHFLLRGDKTVRSLTREMPRNYDSQAVGTTLQAKLAYELFPNR